MMMEWKTLDSTLLFQDPWFRVRKDRCARQDGTVIEPYYVYEFPSWVCAVALTEDGKFIFERQYRHALGLTMMELPGGCVDAEDSDPAAALERELLEETGYAFTSVEYLGKISPNPSTNNNWMHFYLARGGKKVAEQQLDKNEEIEVHLFGLDEVKNMLRKQEIIQSMHVTALFYALEKLGELRY